jgi:hypothetical protein
VLARPYLAKFSYTSFCIVEGSRCLDEMHVSIALQLENAKRRTQPRLRFGTAQLAGTGGVISHKVRQASTLKPIRNCTYVIIVPNNC